MVQERQLGQEWENCNSIHLLLSFIFIYSLLRDRYVSVVKIQSVIAQTFAPYWHMGFVPFLFCTFHWLTYSKWLTAEQLRVKIPAQGPDCGRLVELGFNGPISSPKAVTTEPPLLSVSTWNSQPLTREKKQNKENATSIWNSSSESLENAVNAEFRTWH